MWLFDMQPMPQGSAALNPFNTHRTVAAKLSTSAPKYAPRASKTKASNPAPALTSKQKRWNRGTLRRTFASRAARRPEASEARSGRSTQSLPHRVALLAKRQCVRRFTSAKRMQAWLRTKSSSDQSLHAGGPLVDRKRASASGSIPFCANSATLNNGASRANVCSSCRREVLRASQKSPAKKAAVKSTAGSSPGQRRRSDE
mmetsp:Transcript_1418/g.4114  ORF Transcript_1418/g.4114 Transcript_1418/m.4114 type:complete len:201 (-) Transcript_1418:160-762(-)